MWDSRLAVNMPFEDGWHWVRSHHENQIDPELRRWVGEYLPDIIKKNDIIYYNTIQYMIYNI